MSSNAATSNISSVTSVTSLMHYLLPDLAGSSVSSAVEHKLANFVDALSSNMANFKQEDDINVIRNIIISTAAVAFASNKKAVAASRINAAPVQTSLQAGVQSNVSGSGNKKRKAMKNHVKGAYRNAYQIYLTRNWRSFNSENVAKAGALASKAWTNLTDEQKKPYIDEYTLQQEQIKAGTYVPKEPKSRKRAKVVVSAPAVEDPEDPIENDEDQDNAVAHANGEDPEDPIENENEAVEENPVEDKEESNAQVSNEDPYNPFDFEDDDNLIA